MATTTAKQLTPRQQRVKELHEQGKSSQEIAKALRITPAGVNSHMRAIRRAGALPAARRNGGSRRVRARKPSATPAAGPQVAGPNGAYVEPSGGPVVERDVVRIIKEQIETSTTIIDQLDSEQDKLKEALAANGAMIEARQQEILKHRRALEVYEP